MLCYMILEKQAMKKIISIVAFGILSFILGAASGAIVWLILKIMDMGIEFFWTWKEEL